MGGDSGGPTTNTTYTQAIPPELMPYATKALGYSEKLAYDKPLGQQYGGQMSAGINPLQQQAIGNIQGMQPSQYLGQGAALAGMAGTSQFTGDTAQQYMNPYTSTMQQAAVRDYARNLPGMSAGAARAGGLGGTRSALLQSEGQRNLQNQLQDINAKAYESGRNQFNTQNQNMLAAAGQLGQFGAQDYTQNMGINQQLMGYGTQLQGMEQNKINADYQKWVNEQMEPYQRLNFMSSMIRGTPVQNLGSAMYQPPPSMGSQMLGAGMGLYGLSQASKNAREGGSTEDIKGYAGGGIVSLAKGGSTSIEKMGAIDASTKQLSKSMPPQAANAKVQQTISALPDSIDWQNAAAMMAYNKSHPAVVEPPKQDSVVVQMAKQIAAQADAKKMAEAQKAQQQQMAMQGAQQQGIAGLPTPNVGQNYTPNGITTEPQGAPQEGPQVNAAEGGGIADLQADVGEHYATGGIVAFNGETGSEVEGEPVDERTAMLNRLVNTTPDSRAALGTGNTAASLFGPQQASVVPRPAILTSAPNPTAMPGSTSILQSRDAASATSANLGPRATPSPFAQPLGAINQNTAFNRAAPTLANAIPAPTAAPAPVASNRYDDSRYQAAATPAAANSGIAGIARPKVESAPPATPVEDKRLTDEEYFKKYQDYKERSGLNKATSDISKFLDNEQADAAKDAKYERSLALAQYGFDVASTPGGLLRGIAAGGKGYASSLAAIKKEQSATERSLAKSRLELAQSVAKDDLGAWNKGLDNFRQDTKDLETLRMQQKQLEQSAFQHKQTLEQQRYATDVTRKYYETLAAAQASKPNATLEKYKGYFTAAIDKYSQTGDPKDKAAADHYQEVLQKLVDPTQTKAPAAVSAALAKDKGVEMAQLMLFSAQQSGDEQAIAEAQANLNAAKQQALATAGFTQQLSNASGTGLNSLGGSTGGATFLGFE